MARPTSRRYGAVAESARAIVFGVSAAGTLTDACGPAWFRRDAALAVRSAWLREIHPDDRRPVLMAWRQAFATGAFAALDCRVRQVEGSYRWLRLNAVLYRENDDWPAEWLGTAVDIQDQQLAMEALRTHEKRFGFVVEATALGIWDLEFPSGRAVWTPQARSMVGIAPDAVIDEALFFGLVHPDDRAALKVKDRRVMQGIDSEPYTTIYRLFHGQTGEELWIQEWGRPEIDPKTGHGRIVGALMDITDRRRTEIDRDANEERWRLALQTGRMMAWERQVGSDVVTRSDNVAAVIGTLNAQATASDFVNLVHADDRAAMLAFFERISSTERTSVQFRFRHSDGRERWLESSAILIEAPGTRGRLIGVTSDITAKKAAERSLLRAANQDALTGLLNRNAMNQLLDRAIRKARRAKTTMHLLLLDLDGFKDVNDTLGHDAGDMLLKVTAERLKGAIGSAGAVARLGGDEFAIILSACPSTGEAMRTALLILERLARTFRYKEETLQVKGSIGIACYPDQGPGQSDILKAADLALYAAKNGGRGQVSLYTPSMRSAMEQRIVLTGEIRTALEAGAIVPFYQPKVDLETGHIVGFEALARWIHPVRGVLTPEDFTAAFDDVQLAIAIDDAMLHQVVRDLGTWIAQGLACGRVAINLSSFAFRSPQLIERIGDALIKAAVPASCLEIEVTETVLLDRRREDIGPVLRQFRDMGITIALDDFGTGYASLAHLKRFVVDTIKIDQSFIRDLTHSPHDAAIVSAVIGLARSFGLITVAEGIETADQEARLRAWGCTVGQGFLYAKPMIGSRVPWMLSQTFARRPAPDNFGLQLTVR